MALDKDRMKNAIIGALQTSGKFSADLATDAPSTVEFVDIVCDQIIKEFKDNAKVTVEIDSPMNQIFPSGVPVPTDGGAALQLAWTTATSVPSTHKASGEKSDTSGGIE